MPDHPYKPASNFYGKQVVKLGVPETPADKARKKLLAEIEQRESMLEALDHVFTSLTDINRYAKIKTEHTVCAGTNFQLVFNHQEDFTRLSEAITEAFDLLKKKKPDAVTPTLLLNALHPNKADFFLIFPEYPPELAHEVISGLAANKTLFAECARTAIRGQQGCMLQ